MESLALHLAEAFLAGPWEVDDMARRGARVLGRRYRWLRRTARRVHSMSLPPAALRRRQIAEIIAADPSFVRVCDGHDLEPQTVLWSTRPPMRPVAGAPAEWLLPDITTPGRLAEWLGLSPTELDWFADCQSRERHLPEGPLRHYRYRWIAKRHGEARLIEVPKPRLKLIQRELLHAILDRVPPHSAAHGFRAGRSVKTFAEPHAGRAVVLRMDLRDFFPSINAARVQAIYQTVGYPEAVARLLAGLSTNWPPAAVFDAMPGGCQVPGATTQPPSSSRWRAEAGLTCRKARQPRRRSPTWRPSGSTADWRRWPSRWGPRTRAMQTTWRFRATRRSRDRIGGSMRRLRQSRSTRALTLIRARRG